MNCNPYVGVCEVSGLFLSHRSCILVQYVCPLSKKHLKEFREFGCLVSIDTLFHCRSVDGKKEL